MDSSLSETSLPGWVKDFEWSKKAFDRLLTRQKVQRWIDFFIMGAIMIAAFYVTEIWFFLTFLLGYLGCTTLYTVWQAKKARLPRNDVVRRQRNSNVYRSVYEGTQSREITNAILMASILDSNVEMYDAPLDEVMDNVKKSARVELGIGKKNCSQGHTRACYHRISSQTRQWISPPETS